MVAQRGLEVRDILGDPTQFRRQRVLAGAAGRFGLRREVLETTVGRLLTAQARQQDLPQPSADRRARRRRGDHDELIDARQRIVRHGLEHPCGYPGRRGLQLGLLETAFDGEQVEDAEARAGHQCLQRVLVEEMQMGAIQQTDVGAREAPLHQGEADGAVGHVGHREQGPSPWRQPRARPGEQCPGIHEMLEDIEHQHHVEGGRRHGVRGERVEIGLDRRQAAGDQRRDALRVALDRGHLAAAIAQGARHGPVGRAQVEHPTPRRHREHREGVDVLQILQVDRAAIPGDGHQRPPG